MLVPPTVVLYAVVTMYVCVRIDW